MRISKKHAKELIRQGKARFAGSYYHCGFHIGRIFYNKDYWHYVIESEKINSKT